MENRNGQTFGAQLVTKGRKTGKKHSVWLKAVMYNEKIYFSRHNPDSDWFKNALINSDVKVSFDNKNFEGTASLVKDEKLAKKISELKYPNEERSKEKRVILEIKLCE